VRPVGATEIAVNVSDATIVKVVDPTTLPILAATVVLPAASPVARPAALIDAALGAEDVQTALAVTLPVVPSLYVAAAVYCCVELLLMVTLAGVTAIETKLADAGAVTVKTAEPETLPTLALMFDVPTATAVTRPLPLTVATPLADVDQVALEVTSLVVPSLLVAVAVSCTVEPLTAVGSAGVTEIVAMVGVAGGDTDSVDEEFGALLPHPAKATSASIVVIRQSLRRR